MPTIRLILDSYICGTCNKDCTAFEALAHEGCRSSRLLHTPLFYSPISHELCLCSHPAAYPFASESSTAHPHFTAYFQQTKPAMADTATPVSPVSGSKHPELTLSAASVDVNTEPVELDATPTSPERLRERRGSKADGLMQLSAEERDVEPPRPVHRLLRHG